MAGKVRCPECESMDIKRIHRRSASERFWGLFGVRPYSCALCHMNFYKRSHPPSLSLLALSVLTLLAFSLFLIPPGQL